MTTRRTSVAVFLTLALTGFSTACGHDGPSPEVQPTSSSPASSGEDKVTPPSDGHCSDILSTSGLEEAQRDRVWSVLDETVIGSGVSCAITGTARGSSAADVSVPTSLSFRLTMHVTGDASGDGDIEAEYVDRLKWLTTASASDEIFVGGAERSALQGWWSQGDRFASLQSSGSSTDLFVESLVLGNGAYVNITTRCVAGSQLAESVQQDLLTASDALLAAVPQN